MYWWVVLVADIYCGGSYIPVLRGSSAAMSHRASHSSIVTSTSSPVLFVWWLLLMSLKIG